MQQAAAVDTSHVITAITSTVVAHHNYTTAGLIAIIVLLALALILIVRHKGWDMISNVPTTPLRTLISIGLFLTFNLSITIVGYLTGTYPPEYVIVWIDTFITAGMGLDVAQFAVKRFTTDSNIPSQQNVAGGITQGPAQSPPAPPPTPVPAPGDVPTVVALPDVPTGPVHSPDAPIRPLGPRAAQFVPATPIVPSAVKNAAQALERHHFVEGD